MNIHSINIALEVVALLLMGYVLLRQRKEAAIIDDVHKFRVLLFYLLCTHVLRMFIPLVFHVAIFLGYPAIEMHPNVSLVYSVLDLVVSAIFFTVYRLRL